MTPSDGRRGTYLPSGIRLVGAGADRVAERASEIAAETWGLGRTHSTLFALDCSVPPVVQGRPSVERILEAVTDEVRLTWPECPRLVRDEVHDEPPSRFGGLRTRCEVKPGERWTSELWWRAVHPQVPGAPVTTRLVLEERKSFVRMRVRVTADDGAPSVRGFVGAGQAQPRFLRALRPELPFTWMGGPLQAHPILHGYEVDFVHSILGSATRTYPVAVLSALEEGGYLIEPEELAWELFGRARLYVMQNHAQSFKLSDTVRDRRMSCYWGAARCYMPGWSAQDEFSDHPLLMGDRVADPLLRARWVGEVGMWMGQRVELPSPLGVEAAEPEVEAASVPDEGAARPRDAARGARSEVAAAEVVPAAPVVPVPDPSTDGARATSGADGDALGPTNGTAPLPHRAAAALEQLVAEVSGLGALIKELLAKQSSLEDDVERLSTISAIRASSTNAIERRLGRLETILERMSALQSHPQEPDAVDDAAAAMHADEEEEEGRLTLVDVVHEVSEAHADALLLLDSARDSAADSPYEDPERVRATLDAMARVARRRRDGVLGMSLREAFSDLGIDYRGAISSTSSARLRQQYRFTTPTGEAVEAEEHIVLGNTYDPRRCLRIYFTSRSPTENRFVIGHVGRHFEVRSST